VKKITLVFYGCGDECYEQWDCGVQLYHRLQDYTGAKSNRLRKALVEWLKEGAEVSYTDFEYHYGNADRTTDCATVEVIVN
jgi:hypothetical protein